MNKLTYRSTPYEFEQTAEPIALGLRWTVVHAFAKESAQDFEEAEVPDYEAVAVDEPFGFSFDSLVKPINIDLEDKNLTLSL